MINNMTAKKEKKDWLRKGPAPKYPGGSKPRTFRLPADPLNYQKAVKGIEKLLKTFER